VYKLGDQVVYGIHGVYRIVDIEQRRIDRKTIEYYVLSPVHSETSCFYIPTQNEKALSKLVPLLTEEELSRLLLWAKDEDLWIEEDNSRKQKVKEVLASADRKEMIGWVRTMHIHRQRLLNEGRKFHQADELFLKDAEKLLTTEFAIVLGIAKSAVRQYVEKAVM